ncbi:conjugal transfer protein TraH [Photobacterium damselae]|uniref:IncF plasmid conjugative transfer pilus assembly protein TraH n=2 Tax=Photobacterium damselae TaxID=38293 RepID=D0Z535_PHODD|nr:conjugal transfer protein TraH [Photobacterium damselae]EEZ39252.1 IncF plasmid conjugative transfer pilus assembly protein TraH [Photobacterium damselae subsp. damselae CIP 102761]PSW80321.1 conjugal transfer protein TraH [Photobacterium damselae]SPY45174.1 conjugal transfer pilus assembly protein TraH [Photobacterium damselae]
MNKIVALAVLMAFSASSFAGTTGDLGGFFDGLNYQGNITAPQSYKGQMASYYSGGGAYIRTPVKQAQMAAFTVPEIKAGCGGIDLFSGGFSFINSDQLVQMGKAIVSNAIPFAVDLALQTWAPQLKQIKDRLEAIAREINALSVNSCETAQAGVAALAGFAGVGNKQYICSTMGTQNNKFADWAAAKNGCNNESAVNDGIKQASKDRNLKEHIPVNRNIIWYSLKKYSTIRDDNTSEFFMSLSGTIVYNEKGDVIRYPSLLTTSNDLINLLTLGGKAQVYRCNNYGENQCLKPKIQDMSFSQHDTLKFKVSKILRSIIEKYKKDQGLSDSEKQFLESISLPVLKMMTVSLESGYSLDATVNDYATVISTDLVTAYLQDALRLIKTAIDSKGSAPEDVDKLYAVITQASEQMRLIRVQALQSLEAEQSIIQATMQLEQRVEGQFSAQTRASLLFSKD